MTTVLVLMGLWLAVSVWLIATVAPPGGRKTLESLYGKVPTLRQREGRGFGRVFPEAEYLDFDLWRSHDEPGGARLRADRDRWTAVAADRGLVAGSSGPRIPTLKKRTRLAAKKIAVDRKRAYRGTGLAVG